MTRERLTGVTATHREGISRRRLLRFIGSGGLVGLAGCTGGQPPEAPGAATTPTATKPPTSSPGPTQSPSPTARPAEESCSAREPAIPSSDEEWWPMYQHDTRNSGFNQATTGPTSEIGAAWRFETGGMVRSSPAVVDGAVYVGSTDGNLYAIDMVSGEKRWAFEAGGPIESSPAMIDGLVYVGSHDHHVYAVDAGTGEQQWAFETGGPVRSSPTVAWNMISKGMPAWGEHGAVAVGSDDGNVYILDGKTGEQKYHISTDGPVVASPYIAPYYFIGSGYGPFLHFDVGSTDGSRYGKDVYERQSGGRGALPPSDIGSPIHSSQTTNDDPMDTAGPDIFGTDAGVLHHRYVEGCDGCVPSWEFQTDGKIRGSPALTDDPAVLFVGSWDGHLYAVGVESGEELWTFDTGEKVESSPAVADSAVYFGSANQHVYALDTESGEQLWDFRTGGEVFSSPAVVNGTVFVGSDDSYVYALTSCQ